MAMIVQHNITAMNSNRMLGVTTGSQAKSTEKLSSGFKINRAADDAAGLTISEKMRKQIRGLTQASTNAQDGVSSVQTAEGALTEVHSMLQRMNQLATQAANGTNSKGDRDAIQAEIDQLTTEIDRVAETTKFNEIYLLKGEKATKTINMNAHDAGVKGELVDSGNGKATFTMDKLNVGDSISIGGKNFNIINDGKQAAAVEGTDYKYTPATNATATIDLTGWTGDAAKDKIQVGGSAEITGADVKTVADNLNQDATFKANYKASVSDDGKKLIITANNSSEKAATVKAAVTKAEINSTPVDAAKITSAEAKEAIFSNPNGTKLYTADSDKALTDEEALAALKDGQELFKTPGANFEQKEAKVDYTPATNASITIKGLTGAANDAIRIGTMDAAVASGDGTMQGLVTALNNNAKFKTEYKASLNKDGNLVLTTLDPDMDGAAVEAKLNKTDTTINGVAITDKKYTTADAAKASYTSTSKALYALGGTKALTDEEILSALDKGEKLYANAAGKGDNDLTITEAYNMVKDELLKANSIGDVNGTANVEFADAAKAEDYKAGDKVIIEGKEYTIADTADDAKTALTDAINAAADRAASPANTNNATALTKLGTISDGTNSISIFKGGDEKIWYSSAATLAYDGANTASGADKTAEDVEKLFAAGKTVTFTPDGGLGNMNPTAATVADDESADSTLISAEKAAELVNAPGTNIFDITTGSADVAKNLSFNLHVGADADMTNKIQVDINAMNSTGLGIKGLNVADESGMAATYAIDAIQDAISKVSAQRSALGAVQNRLEHTIANVDNIVENTTAAESRIRDTDMAKEMVEYSKNNILAQAGQAMLAQANQSNQGVLGLLG